jgi:hypothetical protein
VDCQLDPTDDPEAGMSNVNFSDVYLQRDTSGRWLICVYGQG